MCIRFTRMITWGHYFVFRIGQPLTEFGSSFIIMHVHTGTNLAVLLDTKGYNYMWIGQFLGGVFLASKSWAPSHPFSWWQQTASHYIRLVCASMGSCEKSPFFGIHSKRALTEWTGCMKMYWPESGNWEVGVDHLSGIHGDFMGERLQVKMVSITGVVYGDRSKSMHMMHADIHV